MGQAVAWPFFDLLDASLPRAFPTKARSHFTITALGGWVCRRLKRLRAMRLRPNRAQTAPACMGRRDEGLVDCANQHKGYFSRHNLCMHPYAKLSNPYALDQCLFGAAFQSKQVYPPQLSSSALAGIAWQRIDAIR